MAKEKRPPHQPLNRAVDDEDPNYSPMDRASTKKKDESKTRPEDLPGAAGFASARADEDTYD